MNNKKNMNLKTLYEKKDIEKNMKKNCDYKLNKQITWK